VRSTSRCSGSLSTTASEAPSDAERRSSKPRASSWPGTPTTPIKPSTCRKALPAQRPQSRRRRPSHRGQSSPAVAAGAAPIAPLRAARVIEPQTPVTCIAPPRLTRRRNAPTSDCHEGGTPRWHAQRVIEERALGPRGVVPWPGELEDGGPPASCGRAATVTNARQVKSTAARGLAYRAGDPAPGCCRAVRIRSAPFPEERACRRGARDARSGRHAEARRARPQPMHCLCMSVPAAAAIYGRATLAFAWLERLSGARRRASAFACQRQCRSCL
jgi:hypothetical protein